ncbi:MAG: hypothetical protein KAJ36_07575 [Candidatus Thorarchaeota archaeon]|nr:hypothetical protein [Candidatus Thorarchaeota archaeon]MCK5390333.1 hypothetical protein [Candidatus Thorarchaeota archaeon]
MPRWEAAIATENPKILYRTVQLLKKLGINFVICSPTDHRCDHAHIVITGPDDNFEQHERKIEVTEDFDIDFVRIEMISKLHDLHTPSRAVVGIDPGMTFGVALVIDGIPVYSKSLTSPVAVTILTHQLANHSKTLFPECKTIVRIGTGSNLYATLLLRSTKNIRMKLPIELVNEHNTTITGGARSDESAAILIAGRSGRPVNDSDMNLEPKEGYVRSLKQFVTKLTRGEKSITSKEARAILIGDSSLEDLIAQSRS